jgi:hypothetical protein
MIFWSGINRGRRPTARRRPRNACGIACSCTSSYRLYEACRTEPSQSELDHAHPLGQEAGVSWCEPARAVRIRWTDGNEDSSRLLSSSPAVHRRNRALPMESGSRFRVLGCGWRLPTPLPSTNYCTSAGLTRLRDELESARREMPKRKKKKVFRASKAIKESAREKIGSPPPTRLVPDKKKEPPRKHKLTLGRLLAEE